MKTRILASVVALLVSADIATAQIKIVGDEYSSNLTASKNYYDKDVDFDKYFPTLERDNISILYPTIMYPLMYPNNTISDIWRSNYIYKNLTGDTVYLSKGHRIDATFSFYIPSDAVGNYTKPSISFCVDSFGEAGYGVMPKGYYVVEGYVFCTDNEDTIRKSYGFPIIDYSYRWKERNRYSIKAMKNEILKYGTVNASKYIRYIIFRSLASNEKYYLSIIDQYASRSDEEKIIFLDMFPVRFYSEALSFVGKKVKIRENNVELVKDVLSDNLIKLEDDIFVVRDIVMNNLKYYVVLDGEKTGSFALNIRWIYGIKDKSDGKEKTVEEDSDHNYLPNCNAAYVYFYTINDETGDIHCINTFNEESESLSIIGKDDVEILEKRANKKKAQFEMEQRIKEQQRKQAKENADVAFRQQMIKKYGTRFGEMVANKQVAIDMTMEMCHDAWGRPMNTYRTTTKYGQSEVWCYNYKTRVYFYNGKVVQIDD